MRKIITSILYEPRREKTCLRGLLTGPTKPVYTVSEKGLKLELLDLGRRGIVLSV